MSSIEKVHPWDVDGQMAEQSAAFARAAGLTVKIYCRPEGRRPLALGAVLHGDDGDAMTVASMARSMLHAIRYGHDVSPEDQQKIAALLADDPIVEPEPSPVCRNCLFWRPDSERTFPRSERYPRSACDRGPSLWGTEATASGAIWTDPEFGCNQFERQP